MFAIYETDTGKLVSIGSAVADPLPAGMAVLDLAADTRILTGFGYWDTATRTVLDVVPSPILIDANRATITGRAKTALTANDAFLGLTAPTNAQVLAQTKVLTRECSALIRLLLDELSTTAGT